MNIKRYDIFPVNHQLGNEIESAGGRYVRFADVEHLQLRLTAAEQRNAVYEDLLRVRGMEFSTSEAAPVVVPLHDVCDNCEKRTIGLDGSTKWCAYCGGKL